MDKNRDDDGKSRVDLIIPEFITGIGDALLFGTKKYPEGTWKDTTEKHDRNYGSCLRHLLSWRSGDTYDKESGLNHLLHAAYNIMALYYDDLQNGKGEHE